ncbi:hypothetical protein ACVWY0_003201 [Arthrobacter sp. UYNi723]
MEWIALTLLFPLGAVAGWWTVTRPWRLVKARRVVVNLRSGQAIEGLLVRQAGSLLFIAEARLHEGSENPVLIDGQAVVERQTVDFIQIL